MKRAQNLVTTPTQALRAFIADGGSQRMKTRNAFRLMRARLVRPRTKVVLIRDDADDGYLRSTALAKLSEVGLVVPATEHIGLAALLLATHVSSGTLRKWAAEDFFPTPAIKQGNQKFWRVADVTSWARRYGIVVI